MYLFFLKRLIDFFFSLVFFVIVFPVLIIASLIIKYESKGPILFIQKRIGRNMDDIHIFKLRTMTHAKREISKEPLVGKNKDITKFGYYLRRFKIDELPQLVNVIIGDMSLVGPRPNVKEHFSEMNDQEKKRYQVRPGLTGLAQVSGNIHLSWMKRYELDLIYINNITFVNDFKIIMRTIFLLILGESFYLNKPLIIRKK